MKYRPKKTLLNLKYIIHWKVHIHMENSHILKQVIQKAEYFQLSNTMEDATYYVMDRENNGSIGLVYIRNYPMMMRW